MFRLNMLRRISTSLRAAKPLSPEDWSALDRAYPSSTINTLAMNTTKMAMAIAAATGTAVVYATDWLHRLRSAELEAKMMKSVEAKVASVEAKVASVEAMVASTEAKVASMEANVMGKLSSIEEQLRSRGKWTWGRR